MLNPKIVVEYCLTENLQENSFRLPNNFKIGICCNTCKGEILTLYQHISFNVIHVLLLLMQYVSPVTIDVIHFSCYY